MHCRLLLLGLALVLLAGCGQNEPSEKAAEDQKKEAQADEGEKKTKEEGAPKKTEPVVINEDNFEEKVLKAPGPVLVGFWSETIEPSKKALPLLADLASEYEGRVTVGKVDFDENLNLATKYEIPSIPAFLFFQDGEVADKVVGLEPKDVFTEKLDAMLEK